MGGWLWSQPEAQTVSVPATEVHSPIEFDPTDQSEVATEANPFADSMETTPRSVLEAAGGIIEQDAQGQPAGVNLSGAEITAELMQAVNELGKLQWLDLRGAQLADEHLDVLDQLPQLQLLALGNTQITDEGLKSIRGLDNLRFLSLDRTNISDAGLVHLAGLQNLEGVSLQGTLVSQSGAQSLESQIPGCSVIIDQDAPAQSPVSSPTESFEPIPGEPTSRTEQQSPRDSRRETPQSTRMSQSPISGTSDIRQTRQTLASLLQQKLLDPEILEALGQHLLAKKNYAQAARAFEAVLTHEPNNHRAHFGLAQSRAHIGAYESALPHFAAVVGDATAYYNLGVIAYESHHPQQSERFFQQALRAEADFDEARHWLAFLRQENVVTPASHVPQAVDEQELVNLLMSELGRVSPRPTEESGEGETDIQIVPAVKSVSPENW